MNIMASEIIGVSMLNLVKNYDMWKFEQLSDYRKHHFIFYPFVYYKLKVSSRTRYQSHNRMMKCNDIE